MPDALPEPSQGSTPMPVPPRTPPPLVSVERVADPAVAETQVSGSGAPPPPPPALRSAPVRERVSSESSGPRVVDSAVLARRLLDEERLVPQERFIAPDDSSAPVRWALLGATSASFVVLAVLTLAGLAWMALAPEPAPPVVVTQPASTPVAPAAAVEPIVEPAPVPVAIQPAAVAEAPPAPPPPAPAPVVAAPAPRPASPRPARPAARPEPAAAPAPGPAPTTAGSDLVDPWK